MSEIHLFSGAWYGDEPLPLEFPDEWDVSVVGGELHPALNPEKIKRLLQNPISSPPLSLLAKGKTRVAVIVDDITRPTPVAGLLPVIFSELADAGVPESAVRIVIAGGTHASASAAEVRKKLGELPRAVEVVSHNCREDLVSLGDSPGGTPVEVNRFVAECDFKIGIGCIYPHGSAGFSGGSKIVMPGVCGLETVRHAHRSYETAAYRGDPEPSQFRREMDAVAEMVGLDFIVNVVLNQRRQIAGLFAGDRCEAYSRGTEIAADMYKAPVIEDADIVIADAYPFDVFFIFAYNRGLWPVFDTGRKTTTVVLAACPRGIGHHELSNRTGAVKKRLAQRIKKLRIRDMAHPVFLIKKAARFFRKRSKELLMLSPGIEPDKMKAAFPNARIYKDWASLRRTLETSHSKGRVKVALYRCAPLLIPETSQKPDSANRTQNFPE